MIDKLTAEQAVAGCPDEIPAAALIAVLGILGFDAAVAENTSTIVLGPDVVTVDVWVVATGRPLRVHVEVPVRQAVGGGREGVLEAWRAGAAIDRSGFGS
jgi:hypothetical protein